MLTAKDLVPEAAHKTGTLVVILFLAFVYLNAFLKPLSQAQSLCKSKR
jgi:hypothetical protein